MSVIATADRRLRADAARNRQRLIDAARAAFAEVLTATFPPTARSEQERRRAYTGIEQVIARAQQANRLRADFVAEDIVLVLLAHAGVVAASPDLAEQFSDRLLAFLLQAFAAPAQAPLPDPPGMAKVYHALLRLHQPASEPGP